MNKYLIGALAGILAIGLIFAGGYHAGAAHIQAEWNSANEKIETGNLKDAIASDRISLDFSVKIQDNLQVIYLRGATIQKEVVKYVTLDNDRACTINNGFVRVWNAAATGQQLPDTPGPTDATASGVALSTVAGTAVASLTVCRANAEQLTQLQAWVKAQAAIYGASAKP